MLRITEFFSRCPDHILRYFITCITVMGMLNVLKSDIWIAANKITVCNKADCQELGKIYLNNMNPLGNPCNDFYDYVCHSWDNQCEKPEFLDFWNVKQAMAENAWKVIKTLMEDKTVSKKKYVERAKERYEACMKLTTMERSEPSFVQSIMKKAGIWPMFSTNTNLLSTISWRTIDNKYTEMAGESGLFQFYVVVDNRNNQRITIHLGRVITPDGLLFRQYPWGLLSVKRTHYKNFLKKVILTVAPQDPTPFMAAIDKDLERVMDFRNKLREISALSKKIKMEMTTINDFQKWYDMQVLKNSNAYVNWMDVIRAIYPDGKDSNGENIGKSTPLLVQINYFERLIVLLNATPKRDIINHIHLYFAEKHLLLTSDMKLELQQSVDSEKSDTNYILEDFPRWRYCLETHNMVTTLKEMYLDFYPKEGSTEVEKLIEDAKNILKEQISESTWLDRKTKFWSKEKVDNMMHSVAFPDWYNATHSVINSYDADPMDPAAYFVRTQNRMYVTASYLQMPLYTPNLPYAVKYGSILWIIAHELYHGFDKVGIKYGKNGAPPGWPIHAINRFDDRLRCFKKLFENFKKEEIKSCKIGVFKKHSLPDTTIEDQPDAMGLKLAHRMFKAKLKQQNGNCPVLPGFEKLGCEQLFFMSMANVFCMASSTLQQKRSMLLDSHSPNRVRVNAAVANMKEFSEAFGCKPNDPLYMKNTCDSWM